MRTQLQGGTVVGFNGPTHVLIRDGVVVWEGDRRDEVAVQQGLEAACRFISAHDGQVHGRVRGMLYPLQVDTCSRELLQATRQAADSLHVPVQIHTGQNLMEFHQTLRKYRRTPVELLDETGLLRPGTTLGHCIMVSGHPQARYPDGHDLERISVTSTPVACA
jgi:cytosine/adenosine deaminase-related metal-dependent hydrolase